MTARLETTPLSTPAALAARAGGLLATLRDSRFVGTLLRFRWAVLCLLTVGSVAADSGQPPLDVGLFLPDGRLLLSPDWAHVFADKAVQAGPVLLAIYGAVADFSEGAALSPLLVLSMLVQLGTVIVVVRLVRRASREFFPHVDSAPRELAAGLLVLVLGLPSQAYLSGHPSELLIAVLWCHAALDVRAGKMWHAAGRVVLAGSLVTQGALGVAVLFGRPGPMRRVLKPALGVVGACAAVYLPFQVFGVVHTGELTWPIAPTSALAPFFGAGTSIGWSGRLLQAALTLGAGVLIARLLSSERLAIWIIPATLALVRVSIDPQVFEYYWIGAQAAYVLAVCLTDRRTLRRWLPALVAGYAVLLADNGAPMVPAAIALTGLTATAVLTWQARRAAPA
ncbi:MAG: hypothetical protein WCB04_05280 [Mycobacteriales bacterium]